MSKQTLIDAAWRQRLHTYSAPVAPSAKVPAVMPEPEWTQPSPISPMIVAGTAAAAFLGFCAAAAIRRTLNRPVAAGDDIDWMSGLA